MRALFLSAGLLFWGATLHGQAAASQPATAFQWGPAPAVFPAGARMAVVRGDPGQADQFTIQLSLPDGYRLPPHFHPTDEHVTVKQGTFLVGMGDTLDPGKTNALKPGQSGSVPAKHHHFALARGATVVEVTAMGPFAMTYVNPQDDPQKALARP
jgi:quercetin dioxygenase-like cupin family protein